MDSLNAAVGDLAGALRRRREGREPYVRLHDEDGPCGRSTWTRAEAEAACWTPPRRCRRHRRALRNPANSELERCGGDTDAPEASASIVSFEPSLRPLRRSQ